MNNFSKMLIEKKMGYCIMSIIEFKMTVYSTIALLIGAVLLIGIVRIRVISRKYGSGSKETFKYFLGYLIVVLIFFCLSKLISSFCDRELVKNENIVAVEIVERYEYTSYNEKEFVIVDYCMIAQNYEEGVYLANVTYKEKWLWIDIKVDEEKIVRIKKV